MRRYGIITFLMLGLVGCSHLSTPPTAAFSYQKVPWPQRQAALAHLLNWKIDGAFSIGQSAQTTIASFEWTQNAKNYFVQVHSSLDLYGIRISGRPGLIRLSRAENASLTAISPEQLMQQELGWHLPISNLFYWMKGLPAPGPYQAQFDRYGHLMRLAQQGWVIQYIRYLSQGPLDLPQTLILTNPELSIKIVIKHWKF